MIQKIKDEKKEEIEQAIQKFETEHKEEFQKKKISAEKGKKKKEKTHRRRHLQNILLISLFYLSFSHAKSAR